MRAKRSVFTTTLKCCMIAKWSLCSILQRGVTALKWNVPVEVSRFFRDGGKGIPLKGRLSYISETLILSRSYFGFFLIPFQSTMLRRMLKCALFGIYPIEGAVREFVHRTAVYC